MNAGGLPYLDFFLPFPPGNVFIYQLLLLLPDPLLGSRIFSLIIFSFLGVGLYNLLSLFSRKGVSFLVSISLCLYWEINTTDTIGGYYEFACCLIVWGIYLYLSSNSSWSLFLGGCSIAYASLVKQNFVILALALFVGTLWIEKRAFNRESNSISKMKKKYFLLGIASTYVLFALYLVMNGLFNRFFQVMIGGGGKVITLGNLAKNLVLEFSTPSNLVPGLIFAFSCFLIISTTKVEPKKSATWQRIGIIGCVYSVVWNFLISNAHGSRILVVLFAGILITFFRKVGSNYIWKVTLIALTILPPLLVFGSFWASNSASKLQSIFNVLTLSRTIGLLFSMWQGYAGIVWVGSLLWGVVLLVQFLYEKTLKQQVNRKKELKQQVNKKKGLRQQVKKNIEVSTFLSKIEMGMKGNNQNPKYLIPPIIGLLLASILNAFNGSAFLDSNLIASGILSVIFVEYALSVTENLETNRSSIILGLSVLLVPLIISSLIITVIPYQWYGWSEVKSQNTRSKLVVFRNFTLTKTENDFYNKIATAIALAQRNTNPSSTLAVLPSQPIFYAFSKLKKYDLYCPIMHIDICPETASKVDLDHIQKKPPSVLVFFDLGASTMNALEAFYRNGQKSNISKILDFAKSHYHSRSVIEVPNLNDVKVYVFY
jgi:hypothetical protein